MRNNRLKTISNILEKKKIIRNTIFSNIFDYTELKYYCSNCYSVVDSLSSNKLKKNSIQNKKHKTNYYK